MSLLSPLAHSASAAALPTIKADLYDPNQPFNDLNLYPEFQALIAIDDQTTIGELEKAVDQASNLIRLQSRKVLKTTELFFKGLKSKYLVSLLHHFTNLEQFIALKSSIPVLPKDCNRLSSLRTLRLQNCGTKDIQPIFKITTLTDLNISGNEFEYIEEAIVDDKLERGKTLPVEIGNLVYLKTLVCTHNKLEIIPLALRNLKVLKKIDLSSNQITNLSEKIIASLGRLEEIDLSRNCIKNISKDCLILDIPQLKVFNLIDNPLKHEPSPPKKMERGKIVSLTFKRKDNLCDINFKYTHKYGTPNSTRVRHNVSSPLFIKDPSACTPHKGGAPATLNSPSTPIRPMSVKSPSQDFERSPSPSSASFVFENLTYLLDASQLSPEVVEEGLKETLVASSNTIRRSQATYFDASRPSSLQTSPYFEHRSQHFTFSNINSRLHTPSTPLLQSPRLYDEYPAIPSALKEISKIVEFKHRGEFPPNFWQTLSQAPELASLKLVHLKSSLKGIESIALTKLQELSLYYPHPESPLGCDLTLISRLKTLVELTISSGNLTDLPLEITQMPQLEYLDLSSNKIKTLSASCTTLQKLRCLKLSFNSVHIFPEIVLRMPSLSFISLQSNPLDLDSLPKDRKPHFARFYHKGRIPVPHMHAVLNSAEQELVISL